MTNPNIAHLRLYNQAIARTAFKEPGEVAAWLGALQAQDYTGAKWSIGLRLPGATDIDIEQAIAAGTVIRTWPMRGTLHFVAAADVRWLLALLTPRIIASSGPRSRQLELDEATFARSKALFAQALEGGQQLTRDELYQLLERAGISPAGQRGYHILRRSAMDGLICFGPPRGKQETFTLLAEWVPGAKNLARDEALAELTRRYFTSRGPATRQDFAWWSGLTVADVSAGLAMAKPHLIEETFAGQRYGLAPTTPVLADNSPDIYLLPGFDEYMLGYKDRSAVLEASHAPKIVPGNNGMFSPTLVIDGRVAGTWKRTFKKDTVVIEIHPFTPLSEAERRALTAPAERYGKFMGLTATVIP